MTSHRPAVIWCHLHRCHVQLLLDKEQQPTFLRTRIPSDSVFSWHCFDMIVDSVPRNNELSFSVNWNLSPAFSHRVVYLSVDRIINAEIFKPRARGEGWREEEEVGKHRRTLLIVSVPAKTFTILEDQTNCWMFGSWIFCFLNILVQKCSLYSSIQVGVWSPGQCLDKANANQIKIFY